MKFTTSAAAFLALVSSVFAGPYDPTPGFNTISVPTNLQALAAGDTLDITWTPATFADKTVSIILLQGATQGTLQPNTVPVATGIKNSEGKFSWKIQDDIAGFATYGLKIELDEDPDTFQYSFPFTIAKGKTDDSTSSSSSSASVSPTVSPEAHSSTSSSVTTSAVTTPAVATLTVATPTVASSASGAVVTPNSGNSSTAVTTPSSPDQTTTLSTSSTKTGSATSTSSTAVVTAGARKIVAGGFAAFGGLAAAVLVL